MKAPTQKQTTAITAVLDRLKKYKGEEITAHEHPLHKAVVRLEKLCKDNGTDFHRQQFELFYPARIMWYHLIWASRKTRRGVKYNTTEEVAKLTKTLKTWLKKIPQNDPRREAFQQF